MFANLLGGNSVEDIWSVEIMEVHVTNIDRGGEWGRVCGAGNLLKLKTPRRGHLGTNMSIQR